MFPIQKFLSLYNKIELNAINSNNSYMSGKKSNSLEQSSENVNNNTGLDFLKQFSYFCWPHTNV